MYASNTTHTKEDQILGDIKYSKKPSKGELDLGKKKRGGREKKMTLPYRNDFI
jgi:hypothetical protein